MLIVQSDVKTILGGVQNNLALSTLQPFIRRAETEFKKEFSADLYGEILIMGQGDELKLAAKDLVMWYAYSLAQPHIHVRVGDGGMAKNMPANSVMLTKWEYVKLEESNLAMVDFCYETFYRLLDQLQPAAYTQSLAAQLRSSLIISTAAQFTSYFPQMAGSVRMYSKVRPYQVNVEASLKNKITPQVLQEIFSGDYQQLQTYASMYITHLSVYDSLPFLNVEVSEEGIRVIVKLDGTRNELQADKTQIDRLRQSLYNVAKLQLEYLLEELSTLASPTVLPTFYQKFVQPQTEALFFQDPNASPII